MQSDIEIAQMAKIETIDKIAQKIGFNKDDLELYGDYKAKIKYESIKKSAKNKEGKLILVTAMTPTPAGEGKTTIAVGLGQALHKLGKKAIICLREPSLGPVFGVKGGAAGGGWSQVLPMEDINLHFTGDIHAVTTANNLISALIDNHLHQGNELKIDPGKISWRRSMDMNDRSLRSILIGLGGKANGVLRKDGFDITVASEIMAVLCLSLDLADLKKRVEKIIIALNNKNEPVTVKDLKAAGAVTALLKDALKPNLVQTIENSPAFIHGGPFANIAHGCNSLTATKLALRLCDYVVTEAGFGADLGAEKFINIKCRVGKLKPAAVVIVATIRALKHHGKGNLEKGLANLGKHLENMKKFGLESVVALNHFSVDTNKEIMEVNKYCQENGTQMSLSQVWEKGSEGGLDLAKKVLAISGKPNNFHFLYNLSEPIKTKITKIALEIYGADGVDFSDLALRQMAQFEKWGFGNLAVCLAKTQASLSDNPLLLGRPKNFKVTVRALKLSAGAGFIVVLTGEIMTMPGLPKKPAAELIDIDKEGKITGLF